MSEKYSNKEFDPELLDQAFLDAKETARRGQRRFWLLSLVWLIAAIAVCGYFTFALWKFEKQQDNFEYTLVQMFKDAEEHAREMVSLSASLERIERNYLDKKLDEREKQQYAVELAQEQIARQELSPAEEKFFSQQVEKLKGRQTPDSYYIQGISALGSTENKAAIEKLSKAIALRPNYWQAYTARGRAYYAQREYERSIRDFTIVIERRPDATAYASRGYSYVRLGMLEEALEDFAQARTLSPGYWVSYHYQGFAHMLLGKKAEAESDWRKAAELRRGPSGKSGSLENLGLIYLRSDDWEKTLENSIRVNRINAKGSWNWLFQWIAADKLGRTEVSRTAFQRWKDLSKPNDIQTLEDYLPERFHAYLRAETAD